MGILQLPQQGLSPPFGYVPHPPRPRPQREDRDKVADSPSFEREVEPDRRYQVALYRYYGYCWVQAAGSAEHAAS